MDLKLCRIHVTLFILVLKLYGVLSKGAITLQLERYEAKDACCGYTFWQCDVCDPYFTICFKQTQSTRTDCSHTFGVENTHSFSFPHNFNKFQYRLESLGDNVEITINIEDKDLISNDHMDILRHTLKAKRTDNPIPYTFIGPTLNYNIRITSTITIKCDKNYFGPLCDVFCDNSSSSYYCDKDGNKICAEGFVLSDSGECIAKATTTINNTTSTEVSTTTEIFAETSTTTLSSNPTTLSTFSTSTMINSTTRPTLSTSAISKLTTQPTFSTSTIINSTTQPSLSTPENSTTKPTFSISTITKSTTQQTFSTSTEAKSTTQPTFSASTQIKSTTQPTFSTFPISNSTSQNTVSTNMKTNLTTKSSSSPSSPTISTSQISSSKSPTTTDFNTKITFKPTSSISTMLNSITQSTTVSTPGTTNSSTKAPITTTKNRNVTSQTSPGSSITTYSTTQPSTNTDTTNLTNSSHFPVSMSAITNFTPRISTEASLKTSIMTQVSVRSTYGSTSHVSTNDVSQTSGVSFTSPAQQSTSLPTVFNSDSSVNLQTNINSQPTLSNSSLITPALETSLGSSTTTFSSKKINSNLSKASRYPNTYTSTPSTLSEGIKVYKVDWSKGKTMLFVVSNTGTQSTESASKLGISQGWKTDVSDINKSRTTRDTASSNKVFSSVNEILDTHSNKREPNNSLTEINNMTNNTNRVSLTNHTRTLESEGNADATNVEETSTLFNKTDEDNSVVKTASVYTEMKAWLERHQLVLAVCVLIVVIIILTVIVCRIRRSVKTDDSVKKASEMESTVHSQDVGLQDIFQPSVTNESFLHTETETKHGK